MFSQEQHFRALFAPALLLRCSGTALPQATCVRKEEEINHHQVIGTNELVSDTEKVGVVSDVYFGTIHKTYNYFYLVKKYIKYGKNISLSLSRLESRVRSSWILGPGVLWQRVETPSTGP